MISITAMTGFSKLKMISPPLAFRIRLVLRLLNDEDLSQSMAILSFRPLLESRQPHHLDL
jgi:hypothetical protein